ncbi:hypothetical protein LEN26_016432 [Aphanomyces euteiches]|nr:hypothetical protein LEN26_016432 [Aphanomyces euteiches]
MDSSTPTRIPRSPGYQVSHRMSPYTPRRSPRLHSSPAIRDQSQTEPAHPTGDALLQFTGDFRLKQITNTRMETADRVGVQLLRGDDWPTIKQRIWDLCSHHIHRRAKLAGVPPVWQLHDEAPTIDEFDDFISLRHIKRTISPWHSNEAAMSTLRRLRNEVILVCVLKWGNQIGNSKQLAQFTETCIQPVELDRAGAASEEHHQSVIADLKAHWGGILTAMEISWRIWANYICSQKDGNEDELIQKLPPDCVVRQFQAVSSSAQEVVLRIQRQASVASDVVEAMIQDYTAS